MPLTLDEIDAMPIYLVQVADRGVIFTTPQRKYLNSILFEEDGAPEAGLDVCWASVLDWWN